MIFEARSSSRRWISVTLSANLVRNEASSTAESPPPTTAMWWPRKKKPSQVAQVETPWPMSSCSLGRFEHERASAGRHDDRLGQVGGLGCLGVADPHLEGPLGEVDAGDLLLPGLGAEAQRLGTEALHELGPHDALGEAGEVLDLGGEHELAAGLVGGGRRLALEHQRCEVRASGVDGGGEAGRSGSDDDDVVGGGHGGLRWQGRVHIDEHRCVADPSRRWSGRDQASSGRVRVGLAQQHGARGGEHQREEHVERPHVARHPVVPGAHDDAEQHDRRDPDDAGEQAVDQARAATMMGLVVLSLTLAIVSTIVSAAWAGHSAGIMPEAPGPRGPGVGAAMAETLPAEVDHRSKARPARRRRRRRPPPAWWGRRRRTTGGRTRRRAPGDRPTSAKPRIDGRAWRCRGRSAPAGRSGPRRPRGWLRIRGPGGGRPPAGRRRGSAQVVG
jgi:hypothetical protein